jgi:hypothetical protein
MVCGGSQESDTPSPDFPETEAGPIVYDVVHHVSPGATGCCRAGSWLVGTFATKEKADHSCGLLNQYRTVGGNHYEVFPTREDATDRHQYLDDVIRDECVPEGWESVALRSVPNGPAMIYRRTIQGWFNDAAHVLLSAKTMNTKYRNGLVEIA